MFKPGVSGYPQGRTKGVPNKSTEKIKMYYMELLEGNLDNIQVWLNHVAENDPAKALDFLLRLSPFVIPKKSETDLFVDSPIRIIIPAAEDKTTHSPNTTSTLQSFNTADKDDI